MKIIALCLAALVSLAGLPSANAADAPCGLVRVAELPVDISHGQLLVKMNIDGQEGQFLIDTGSPYNSLSRRMVEALHLNPMPITPGMIVFDAAGAQLKHFVIAKKLTMNDMVAENKEFLIMGESSNQAPPFDGIFGASFLAAYDLELDLPHGKIRLFSQDHCKGQVVYWTQDFTAVPFTMDNHSLHIMTRVTLDGNSLQALLDSGATPSTITAQTARRTFNIDPAATGAAPDGKDTGGSGTGIPYYRHRFANLDIGGVEFHNTELQIISDKLTEIYRDHERIDDATRTQRSVAQVTIGLHHLSKIRAYIAYDERMLYISAADATQ